MIKSLLTIFSVLLTAATFAQEKLVRLGSNAKLANYEDVLRKETLSSRANDDTLSLPFFDDFSEPFSRLRTAADLYPNNALWLDDKVYINNHMAINPISQGVATFDGLDERGEAYGFVFPAESVVSSDTLTSKPINLSNTADTVYLSFFYQPQGLGNRPDAADKLVVEFRDTAGTWSNMWDVAGYGLTDSTYVFRRQMIAVTDAKYLYNGFQFRFRAYASLAGNHDHWHIDYVDLDEGRTLTDTLINDLSYMGQTSFSTRTKVLINQTNSFLNEYASMPWSHYLTDTSNFMIDSFYVAIRSNLNDAGGVSFDYRIKDEAEVELDSLSGDDNTIDLDANELICGSEWQDCGDAIRSQIDTLMGPFYFPTTLKNQDSTFFSVEYRIEGNNDDVVTNDRSVFKQEFYNYYAYDDGTAEAAYGFATTDEIAMVALKYDVKKLDNIRALQIYLNPATYNLSDEDVQLAIWLGEDEPVTNFWTSEPLNLVYSEQINYFQHYFVDPNLPKVSGTIWIGWIQQPRPDIKFTIGLDKRTDNSDKLFYNLGTNWIPSSIVGSVMIRPTFGQAYTWVGTEEKQVETIKVFPNPTTGILHLSEAYSGQFSNAKISFFDLAGRKVYTENSYHNTLNISFLPAGTYILRVGTADEKLLTQRIILQP